MLELSMTNEDKILAVLKLLPNGKGICDDCLSEKAGISPRQTVNQICRRLGADRQIIRASGDCTVSHHLPNKILNFYMFGRSETSGVVIDAPTGIEKQTDILSQWLYDANMSLNRVENLQTSAEPFAARVARLRREGTISGSFSALMQMLNTYRVQVVKERKPLANDEWQIATRGIRKCYTEWKQIKPN